MIIFQTLFHRVSSVLLFLFLVFPSFVSAQGIGGAKGNLSKVGAKLEAPAEVETVLGTVISTALMLVGVIFLLLMVYAGILWMTAKGDEGQIDKAKNIVTAAVIGLVLTVSANAITALVLYRFS